ncbi:protein boule-like isoform X2 [Rhopilema esculentum]|uniref:protein boule-like isoform X2 n=1 Tax=Rhopilema esculentum TaxID=499914 RepID=UPI0031D49FFB
MKYLLPFSFSRADHFTINSSSFLDHSTYIYGVRYPNRVFVGGLPRETTATDLASFFSKFGRVTESKVILNEDGTSKGYGFITFATSEDVAGVFGQGVIFYKQKKLNLGPAIRKQAPETPGEPIYMLNLPAQTQISGSPPPKMQPSPPALPPPCRQNSRSPTLAALPAPPANARNLPIPQAALTFPQHCYQSISMVDIYPQALPFAQNFQWFPTLA